MVDSLRDYLSLMEKAGLVLRIGPEVHKDDIPELIDRLSRYRKVLVFEAVRGYPCRLAANLAPSHDVFRTLFGTENPYEFFAAAAQKTEKTVATARADLESATTAGKDLMDLLPILKHYEKDSAPFITSGIVSSRDPETGAVGRGVHRMEYRGGNRLGITLLNPPLTTIHDKYRDRGEKMPISVSIGVDPLVFISMAMKVSDGRDKLETAGGLKGKGIEVMPSFDSPTTVPADAEYLLEGYVDDTIFKQDGPMGEISGYYLSLERTPTFVVERVSHRESPFYHALLPTCPEADMYLTFVSRVHLEEPTKKLFPFVTNLTFVGRTFGSSLVASVRSSEKFKIRSLMLYLLSFPMIKKVVVVDEDVNPADLEDVEWAVITRCRTDEDMVVIPRLQGQPIDPTVQDVYGGRQSGHQCYHGRQEYPGEGSHGRWKSDKD